MYTYFPFFRLTLLHPSHSFLTELRTFMPRTCVRVCDCILRPAKREMRVEALEGESVGRHKSVHVWIAFVEILERSGAVKRVRRRGRSSVRGSMVAVWKQPLVGNFPVKMVPEFGCGGGQLYSCRMCGVRESMR